jgi:GNAT superfamily N-acetyltransferase
VPGRLTAWVRIERFDPIADQQRLRACFQIVDACGHHDDPDLPHQSFAGFANGWAHGWGNPTQTWLACNEVGEPIGCYLLVLPDRDNPTMASCALFIAPAYRRSGHGRRLLAHCADQARLAGRSRLTAQVAQDSPAAAFAVSAGARIGISEVLRVLTVDDAVRSRLPGLRAEATRASRGYSLVSWLGATPEEHIHGAAGIELAMADAPRDPGVEPESWDADRIRKVEQLGIAAGQQFYAVAALHDDSGEMVALTKIGTSSAVPGWGFQYLTAVLADHRGHRLGLLVKTANLELVLDHEPGLRSIVTGNAGPNDHMITINDTLGFRLLSERRNCELDLTATWPRG